MPCILIQATHLPIADSIRTGLAALWPEADYHIDPNNPCDLLLQIGPAATALPAIPTLWLDAQTHSIPGGMILKAPVKLAILVQRLKDLAARPMVHDWNGYRLDMAKRLWQSPNGEVIELTEKEVALLAYLGVNKAEPVTRDDLLRDVWKYAPGADTHTIETHLYRLRQKIEVNPEQPAIVVNTSEGYILGILAP